MAPYRIKDADSEVNKATHHSRSMAHFLKNLFNTENRVLIDLPEWSQGSLTGTEKSEESEVNNNLFYLILYYMNYIMVCNCVAFLWLLKHSAH